MSNSSQPELLELYKTICDIRILISIILAPLNITGSVLVLKAIQTNNDLQKISTFNFIANLAISDIFCSLFSFPLLATMKYYASPSEALLKDLCTTYAFFFATKRLVSALTLFALSLDKVLACVFHLKYNDFLTTSRAYIVLVLIWTISTSVSLLHWAESDTNQSSGCCRPSRAILDTCISVLVLTCFLVVFASNIYLMVLSRKHQQQDREQRNATSTRARRMYDSYQSVRSLFLLLCMFGFGLFPVITFSLIQQLTGCDTLVCLRVAASLTAIHYIDLNTRSIMYCCRFKSLLSSVLKILGYDKFQKKRVFPAEAAKGARNVTLVGAVEEKIRTIST